MMVTGSFVVSGGSSLRKPESAPTDTKVDRLLEFTAAVSRGIRRVRKHLRSWLVFPRIACCGSILKSVLYIH